MKLLQDTNFSYAHGIQFERYCCREVVEPPKFCAQKMTHGFEGQQVYEY
jgi:hypothetical protein